MNKIGSVIALSASLLILGGCASTALDPIREADATRRSLGAAREGGASPGAAKTNGSACSAHNVSPYPGVRQWDVFALGDLSARECAVELLQDAGDLSRPTNYLSVRTDVMRLHGFYNRRAQRQQTFMDIGSGISVIGAAGAFEGGISNSTREAWAIAAFVPVVISQFNAHEPTRELFHGGALALQLITLRYDRYNRALSLLGEPAAVDCAPIAARRDTILNWTRVQAQRDRDPEGVLLAEVRRLHAACVEVKNRADALAFTRDYARRLSGYLAADYAADVLQLDHAIVGKDRELRYTPSETLNALVASPLRAADMLLTGQNTKAALDSLKTQIAFTGLNRNLATIDLPPLPTTAPPVSPLSEAALALVRPGGPSEVEEQVGALRTLAERLRDRQRLQAFELRMAGELTGAAGADYLTFAYDAATATTTVSLGPRPRDPLASASTGAGQSPAQ